MDERFKSSTLQVLELSTANITGKTAAWLKEEGPSALLVAKYDTGFFVWVDPIAEDIPVDLQYVFAFAGANGFHWVRLDAEASTINELATFDW